MKYINTDDSEKYDIKYVVLTESPLGGSTARFICDPIVDDVEADPDAKEEYQPPNCHFPRIAQPAQGRPIGRDATRAARCTQKPAPLPTAVSSQPRRSRKHHSAN